MTLLLATNGMALGLCGGLLVCLAAAVFVAVMDWRLRRLNRRRGGFLSVTPGRYRLGVDEPEAWSDWKWEDR